MTTLTPKKPNEVRIKQAATSDIAAVAARLNATADDPLPEWYPRAREDGIAWARDHATADELRNLVENFEPGPEGNFDKEHSYDNPHWREFVAGAEEVLDLDATGPLPNATVDDQQAAEYQYQRGCGDGIAWARDYATTNELRDLVENFDPGPDDIDRSPCDFTSDTEHVNAIRVPHHDSPYWRGFVAGAEEVLNAAGPLLNDPAPHDYREFEKWLLKVAP
ncbi:MAG: hypothetical protein WBP81_34065 [Solirubrobacteraceae bacterium]